MVKSNIELISTVPKSLRRPLLLHLSFEELEPMGSRSLLALTAKHTEILECIRLLEARPTARCSFAVNKLVERLRNKADWLNRRIDLEMQQSDPLERTGTAKTRRDINAA